MEDIKTIEDAFEYARDMYLYDWEEAARIIIIDLGIEDEKDTKVLRRVPTHF